MHRWPQLVHALASAHTGVATAARSQESTRVPRIKMERGPGRHLLGGGALDSAGEAQQGGRNRTDGDGHVKPRQERSLVCEEGLGFDSHRRRASESSGRFRSAGAAVEVPVQEALLGG